MITSRNPATGQVIKTYSETSPEKVETRLAQAELSYRLGLERPFSEVVATRARVLGHAAELLTQNVETYARTITEEMGKTLASSRAEVLKSAACCRYYAEHGASFLKPESLSPTTGSRAELHFEPLGTVLGVMPWNFPYWQVFRCAAPILLSGNSMILKHASSVPGSSLAIESIWQEAFAREKIPAAETPFSVVLIPSSEVGKLINDPRIRGVTLTGSEGAGRSVAETAGRNLKRTVLELGGSDPFIVFSSANVERAVSEATKSRTIANGQSCIAAKRFIVHDSVYEIFQASLVKRFKALVVGDPTEEKTQLGPVANAQIRDDLHSLVSDAEEKGARITLGGKIPSGPGFYYPATIIENIPPKARLATEEAFGPVASLYRFKTVDEAITIANSTPFGLGASIWTEDEKDVAACSRRLESGQLFINEIVASDPAVPFGGVKNSGYGRELGVYGVREWVVPKPLVGSLRSKSE